ncbi:MAG: 1-acyl-sn-glycerol-3-phosphate acyltransferase [Prochlorococcus marinus CUG1439]|uniref:lysophospholipid acyltransferase family protein n=1 Tax=Prochlorococcus sp. MIT 1314 TaxID=3096220 RepID=UPI001B2B55EA|nr:lysophospholipid acyltransferase family protein [Prochlorococcus sp. MIT 1314]MCR8540464.1 1-acyl-sn-glycerol-3-phosphate acyltransferase [Prochlorococcus marinus CUG1439]
MVLTQDIVIKVFFSEIKIKNRNFSIPKNSSIILAPTHRSRWDGLVLTKAMGRRITSKDCRFMVTKPEMKGIQGWFLKRLGCFSINQLSPSLSILRYAVNLIVKKNQLVVFPEGKINKYGKKLILKEGLYRLALLASKKTTSIFIIPIGIAYSQVPPRIRGKVSLCFGEPLLVNKSQNLSIKKFNEILNKRMHNAEKIALKNVGR